jgi:exoribonuclease R
LREAQDVVTSLFRQCSFEKRRADDLQREVDGWKAAAK